ncbi:MAG TPA: WD40 repeat domain-containing protein [Candidatus Paceibacterota bacterium]|nr:WD40 repeat domain-containing protein [Candidatus Paceibacterota bacterium]
METPSIFKETIKETAPGEEPVSRSKSLAFGVEFEETPETKEAAQALAELQEAIWSDKATQANIDAIKASLEALYRTQKESLKRKFWEAYNQRLPEGMRFPHLPENCEGMTVKETLAGQEGHKDAVWTLQVLPDGRIVSGSNDRTIKIWEK